MSDYADRYTDKKISEVDRELKKTYRTAQKELKKKLADFNAKFAGESREKQKQLAAGEITKKEYQDWLTGQVFIRSKINEQLKVVNAVMLDHNKQAMNLINTANLDVFAEGYNFSAYLAERDIFASFQVYNTQAVARLILGDPDLLPKWKIDEPKDYRWNAQRVNNIIRQGIIQGKGVPEITDDLCTGLATSNYKKMRMFARTAIGSAEEAGRQKQMNDLAEMGVEVLKKWLATHDGKTRDTHREMDGEEVPYDQPFSNGLMFPKDPTGAAEEIYNCRCVMRTVIPKYENRDNYWRENDTIEGQTYEEWKAGKKAKGQVKSVESYDKEIEWLRAQRQKLFDQDDYDKNVTDGLLKQILNLEDEREKFIGERKSIVRTDDESVMKGFSKMKETGCIQTAKATNPRFDEDKKYKVNCSCCVVANEMRARGYDVIARAAEGNMRRFRYDTRVGDGCWTDCFKGIKCTDIEAKRKDQQKPKIDSIMQGFGKGSRAVVFVEWDRGGGHYFTAQNVDGKVIYTNPQNVDRDAEDYFNYSRPTKTRIFRVDNCEATDYVKKAVENNAK